jgi:hypothetical protein
MKEKLYSIKRKFIGLETDKSFRVSKRTLLNKEKRHWSLAEVTLESDVRGRFTIVLHGHGR